MSLEKIFVSIIAAFIQTFGIVVLICKLILSKYQKDKIKIFIIMFLYGIIGFLLVPNQFRFLIFVTVLAVTMKFILKLEWSEIILYSFSLTMIFSFSEVLITFILISFGIDSSEIVNNIIYNLIANILITLLAVGISYLPIINHSLKKILKVFLKNQNLVKYLYILLIVLYLIILKNGLELILKSNYYINILFIVLLTFIITIIIKNELKAEQLKQENQQMLNYVTKYEKIITEQGKVNHEFKNQLMVIRGYAQMNSPKLIEYLNSIVDDVNRTHSSYLISQLNKFPDGGIKGLLYYKLSIMDDEKIKYEINVQNGIKTKLKSLNINMYKNITKILGVLLDNAIDASKKAKEKKIIISVLKNKKMVIFKIYNTYKGKLDISKIGTGYTTKGKGHGYGLKLVKDIVKADDIFNLKFETSKEYFINKLEIKIVNNK